MANADKFTTPILKFITEWGWGEIWSRPGLDRKTRSFINVAMLTALNRSNEVRLHVRAALRNGLTRQEIGEVIMHTAIYCAAPAALDSMKAAVEVFKEIDAAA
jgi:4-carboxymuconolactone decarboxylase